MDRRGQIDTGGVLAVIGVLVAVIVGGLAFSKVYEAAEPQVASTGTTFSDNTANSSFANGSASWDNYVENLDATWITNTTDNLTIVNEDNEPGLDNGIFYQALAVTDIHDKVSAATVTFKYCIVDNSNADTLAIRVELCNGTDNTTIFYENTPNENATTWTSVENNVLDNVSAIGTYTVYFRVESEAITGTTENADPAHIQVDFDDVKLTIDTYDESAGESAVRDVGQTGTLIFSVMAIMALVGIVILLVVTFVRRE